MHMTKHSSSFEAGILQKLLDNVRLYYNNFRTLADLIIKTFYIVILGKKLYD